MAKKQRNGRNTAVSTRAAACVSCELEGRRYHATFDAALALVVVELEGIFKHATPVAQNGEWSRSPRWLPAEARALLEAALRDELPA